MAITQETLHEVGKSPVTLRIADDLHEPLSSSCAVCVQHTLAPDPIQVVRVVCAILGNDVCCAVFLVYETPVVDRGEAARRVDRNVASLLQWQEVGLIFDAAAPELLGYEGQVVLDFEVLRLA